MGISRQEWRIARAKSPSRPFSECLTIRSEVQARLGEHSDIVTKVALSENGLLAVSASLDETVRVWDLERGREVRTLEGGSGSLRASRVGGLAISQDGRRVARASLDRGLEVWDLETGTLLATFTCDATTLCCAFINPGNLMAGDALGRVHFLRLEEPKLKG